MVPTEHLPFFCLSPPCIFSCGTDGARVLLRLNPSKTCAFSPQPTSIYSRRTDAIPELLRLSPPPFLGVVPTGNTCTLSPQSTPIFFVWYRRNTFAFSRPTPPRPPPPPPPPLPSLVLVAFLRGTRAGGRRGHASDAHQLLSRHVRRGGEAVDEPQGGEYPPPPPLPP